MDTFGESGQKDELMDKYGLRARNIIEAAHKILKQDATVGK
jgi:transketolase C-terminal domain/subunit